MADNAPSQGAGIHAGTALCYTTEGIEPVLAAVALDNHREPSQKKKVAIPD